MGKVKSRKRGDSCGLRACCSLGLECSHCGDKDVSFRRDGGSLSHGERAEETRKDSQIDTFNLFYELSLFACGFGEGSWLPQSQAGK